MKIYRIKPDSNNIQAVQPIDGKKINLNFLSFDGTPRIPDWETLIVFVFNPKTKAHNFFNMGSGILLFDEIVLNACESVFEMAGEILPIKVERGPNLFILNILKCMNGLDYASTVWDYYQDGTKGRILKYAFHKDRIINESSLFKIPETVKTDIFCISDETDPIDEFYHIYIKNKFSGLIFTEMK